MEYLAISVILAVFIPLINKERKKYKYEKSKFDGICICGKSLKYDKLTPYCSECGRVFG